MTTDWTLLEAAESYEDYDPIRERTLAYPVMFDELGLADPERKTVLDYGCGTGRVAERMVRNHDVSVVAADPSPGSAPMTIVDYHWPKDVHTGSMSLQKWRRQGGTRLCLRREEAARRNRPLRQFRRAAD